MKKHMRIGAASCLDMIDAFKSKVAELDPDYIGSAETIDAGEDVCPECGNPSEECVCSTAISAGEEVCPECGEPFESCQCGTDCDGCDPIEGADCGEGCDDPVECADEMDQDYIQGGDGIIDEIYVDEMMQYVADATTDPEFDAVCSWRVEGDNLVFTLTGFDNDSIEEYTCPLSDLTGDVDADIDYILNSIRNIG